MINQIRVKHAKVKIAILNGLFSSAFNATASTTMDVWEIRPTRGRCAKTISALVSLELMRTGTRIGDVA